MLPYALDKIDAVVFQELCDQRTSKSETLDFKQIFPVKVNDNKEKVVKDISSLLNAEVGDLAYGISEDRATGTAKAVLPMAIDNFDRVAALYTDPGCMDRTAVSGHPDHSGPVQWRIKGSHSHPNVFRQPTLRAQPEQP